jgi:uncharacterized membrane-anchored protein
MAKRAGIWAVGAVAVLVLWPMAFGMADTEGNALVPPAGELWIAALFLAVVGALSFAVAYAVQRRRRRDQVPRG